MLTLIKSRHNFVEISEERERLHGSCEPDKIVRLVYFDEAGSSLDNQQEPILLVAGVIVHGDQQSTAIEREAQALVERLVPDALRADFEFHGKELFSGSNRLRGWPQAARHEAAFEFLKIAASYELPIRYCALDKPGMAKVEGLDFDRATDPFFDHQFAWLQPRLKWKNGSALTLKTSVAFALPTKPKRSNIFSAASKAIVKYHEEPINSV